MPERMDALCGLLFGRPIDDELRGLRYQLVHAVAGTLVEAEWRDAGTAVFLIHEFNGPTCRPENTARNAADLSWFLTALGMTGTEGPRVLLGPLTRTVGAKPVDVFVGHVETLL